MLEIASQAPEGAPAVRSSPTCGWGTDPQRKQIGRQELIHFEKNIGNTNIETGDHIKKTNIQKAKTRKPKSQACINSKLLKEHPQCARRQDVAGASILRGNKLADTNFGSE